MRILIVGSGAREHAIAKAFTRSPTTPTLFCCASSNHPGIRPLTKEYWQGNILDVETILQAIRPWNIDLAIIGPEAPLEKGLADALEKQGIATVGPKKILAQIETSKSFTRTLFKKFNIPGSLTFRTFHDLNNVMDFLHDLGEGNYVIKADGLMGGKGVKVAGDHLPSFQEAYQFCEEIHRSGQAFVIEEKLIGQEFSLLSFCDGHRLIPMPLVQDHKRAFINDTGPNTGGMGSYSDANHQLPFLSGKDVQDAHKINQAVIEALAEICQEKYRGILYGSFIATRQGVQLIEYNARLGDPEAINVLALLETDLVEICHALTQGHLSPSQVRFHPLATVCKYAVPLGYPDQPQINVKVDIAEVTDKNTLYFGAINENNGELYATGSRAIAVVGVAPTIAEAEKIAEAEIARIKGPLFHREDIGTSALLHRRVQMMQQLRHPHLALS